MRLKWSVRSLLAVVTLVAIVTALQVHVSRRVSQFANEINSMTDVAQSRLMSDAGADENRRFATSPPIYPLVIVDDISLYDLICFRRKCTVKFTTFVQDGRVFTYFNNANSYSFDLSGGKLVANQESWKWTFE